MHFSPALRCFGDDNMKKKKQKRFHVFVTSVKYLLQMLKLRGDL